MRPLTYTSLLLLAALWYPVRVGLEASLADTARRGLFSIVELTAADLERVGRANSPRGAPLIALAAAKNPGWARALRKVADENRRRVVFFDARGGTYEVSGAALRPTPAIVDAAVAVRFAANPPQEGVRFRAYPGVNGKMSVGVWRWLPELELGIVAERPHGRFALPLYGLDALFAVALVGFLARTTLFRRLAEQRQEDRDAPKQVGPYRIESLLGEGAMSRVYLARHQRLGRRVALKLLKLHLRGDELSHRFEREARLAASLHHPRIVTVYDHGRTADGAGYYAMEYIAGLTLGQWVEEHGPLPADRVIRLLRQITEAILAMHERHLLHRDIKPDNVMAYAAHGDADLVKLLDFGLIRDWGQEEASRDLTRNPRVLGTPAFMAPERLDDPRLVDPRTDLYGIGCIGFWLLCGRRPFEAGLDADLVQQVRFVPAPRASAWSAYPVPEELDQLVADCLAKDRNDRPSDAGALLKRLDAVALASPWNAEAAREWWRLRPSRTTL